MVAHTQQAVSSGIELEFKLLPTFCCSLKNEHLKINLSDLSKGNFITRELMKYQIANSKVIEKANLKKTVKTGCKERLRSRKKLKGKT